MLAVVDLWVVLMVLGITILFMCALLWKISQMDAKMKNDHAEMLRCDEKVEKHFSRFLGLHAGVHRFMMKEQSARHLLGKDVESLKHRVWAQESRTDGNYDNTLQEQSRICRAMDILYARIEVIETRYEKTPVDAAQPAALE